MTAAGTDRSTAHESTGGSGEPERNGGDFKDKVYIAIDGVHRDDLTDGDMRNLERMVKEAMYPTGLTYDDVRCIRGEIGVVEFEIE